MVAIVYALMHRISIGHGRALGSLGHVTTINSVSHNLSAFQAKRRFLRLWEWTHAQTRSLAFMATLSLSLGPWHAMAITTMCGPIFGTGSNPMFNLG